MSMEGGAPRSVPTDGRVPIDQRVLGFDRRTFVPGLVALAMWFVWMHGVPFINDQIDYDNPAQAGDVIDLGAGELTFAPAVGWQIEQGVLVDEETTVPVALPGGGGTGQTALVTRDGVSVEVRARAFDGTPDELLDILLDTSIALDDIALEDVQEPVAITTEGGVEGVVAPFEAYQQAGFVAALVVESEGIGIEVTLRAPEGASEDLAPDVGEMLASLSYDEEAGS